MPQNIWIFLAFLSTVTLSQALPDVHKYMSPHQLQSIFHTDNAADIPHYEVIQLLHHASEPGANAPGVGHYRNRRSINVVSSSASDVVKESHHVKKDLSKNPYYSELKAAATNAAGGHAVNSVYANSEKSRDFVADLSKLEAHNVSFSAFGKHHNLTLRPTQGLFKGAPHMLRMWTANSEANATHGLDLQELLDEHHNSDDIGHVFQDEDNMAAILMRRHPETGDLIMEGSIGHEMVIKPLPHALSPHPDQAHHIIYKREPTQMDHLSDFAYMEPDDIATSEKLEKLQQQRRQRRSANFADLNADEAEFAEDELEDDDELSTAESRTRLRREAPYMIYPEILVIVDYDGYRLHGGDNLQVKRYFISFWNGVDLRYRLLKGPRIRISIAGIIISRGRDATPYLERNRVGRDAIDSAAALTDMGKYLFRERRLPVYDIAVAITKLDMCRRTSAYGECNRGTAGFAYVGGACVVNKRLEKVNSVAIIEDTGGFSGIIVAAHEVGHLLGAVHDGSPPPSYLGGPGAQRCRWEDGYIMSDLRHTERGFRWSPCTVQSFHHFLNGDTATCLHNQPHEDSALGRSLPGTLLSLDAQCRRDRGTYACFKDERVCAQLFCFDAQTGYCVAYRPAAEGSSCGSGLHCLDGRCAPLPTNNIGYGAQYLAYNNADGTKSAENTETSSEEEDGGDDDDNDNDDTDDNNNDDDDEIDGDVENEGELEEDENGEEYGSKNSEEAYKDENVLQNLQKPDNSVEETSLEVTDEKDKVENSAITTTLKPKTTTTTARTATLHTPHTTPTQIQTQLNAIEYLKYLLQNKAEWQHLLSTTTATETTTLTPTTRTITTTTDNLRVVPQPKTTTGNGARAVTIKTSTSSSVSMSSSSSSRSISSNNNSSSNSKENSSSNRSISHERQQQQQVSNRSSSSNEVIDSKQNEDVKEYQQQQQQQQTLPIEQHQQQQQKKYLQKSQKQQTQQQHKSENTATGFRKQFQYYLNLLQQNSRSGLNSVNTDNSGSSNINSSSSSNSNIDNLHSSSFKQFKSNRFTATTANNKPVTLQESQKNSNYSATNNRNGANGNVDDDNNDDDDFANDNNNDNDDDNVESNEAIDKQKRKFDVKFTTRLQQQQQEQQQQQKIDSTTATNLNVPTVSRNIVYGGRTPSTARSNTFLDAYFRKLQAFNAPPTKSVSTTTSISSSTTSTSGSGSILSKKQQQQQQHQKQFDKYAGHFLKRTLSSSSYHRNSSYLSHINNNHQQHDHQNSTNLQQHENAGMTTIATTTTAATTTQQPPFVTNYIGDQTNNSPIRAIIVNAQTKQLQTANTPIGTIQQQPAQQTALQPQQQSVPQQQQQQKQQKIKTQKLLRRQLRTQIK